MCFTDARKKELPDQNGLKSKRDTLKLVANQWRDLSPRERAFWDEEARNDKVR
jgi:hypothetical protein